MDKNILNQAPIKIKILTIAMGVAFLIFGFTQHGKSQAIRTIDIVSGSMKYEREIMYFYKQNWTLFRDHALQKNYISGYQLMRTGTDSTRQFKLILITEYPDSTHYSKSEENFQELIKELRPNGASYLNEITREQFLKHDRSFEARSVYGG